MVAVKRLSNVIAPHPWVVGLNLCYNMLSLLRSLPSLIVMHNLSKWQ